MNKCHLMHGSRLCSIIWGSNSRGGDGAMIFPDQYKCQSQVKPC